MPESSTTLKQKAIELFNSAVEKAKEFLVDIINAKIEAYVSSLLAGAAITVRATLDKLTGLKDSVKTAVKTYNTAVSAAKVAKAAALGTEEVIIEAAKQAAELYKNNTLKIDGLEIDVGINEKTEVFGAVDNEIEPDNSNVGLYLKFNGAKVKTGVKIDSIDELIKVAKIINKKLNGDDPITTRAWVHKVAKTHPFVDNAIKDLLYFKPTSEQIGSTYLLHTSDTQTLALEDWSTQLAIPIRNVLKLKMDDTEYNRINDAYYSLNKGMTNNISTEFYDQRKNVNNNYLNKNIYSNDYHIAGDYSFAVNHLALLEQILMTLLIRYVGGAGKLINWLSPVNTYRYAYDNGILINVEGNNVVVDLKGNKTGVIARVIDEKPISEVDCE